MFVRWLRNNGGCCYTHEASLVTTRCLHGSWSLIRGEVGRCVVLCHKPPVHWRCCTVINSDLC